MKAKIFSNINLIGTTELQVGDQSMGCVFGDFVPTETYFKDVQKFVWEFWKTKRPNYKKWHSLRFNIQLENGYYLYPAGGYTIDDNSNCTSKTKRIDIAGIDRHIIEDFFLQDTPRPFVVEPWNEITIEQKITFEDELTKELGLTTKSVFDFSKFNRAEHVLADFEFSALSKYECNDDVLFAIRKQGFDKQFAIVHLTWTGKKEKKTFPITKFYSDFDDFKYSRMYPDKTEWEN